MTRRELLLLIPLLVLYLAAWAFFPARPDDEASYVALAERLAEGRYVTGDDEALLDPAPDSPDLWFGPGLPALLAPLAALDAPLWLLRLTGPALLFGAVLAFFALAGDAWGPRVGLGATYALGLYPPFLGLLSNLHSEVLAIFLVCVGMLCLARLLRSGGAWWWLLGSATALAGLALTRVAYGWVLTVALVALALRWATRRSPSAGRAALAIALALALCLPWLGYTYAKTDRVFVWGSSGGLSLYWMASPYPGDLGDWHQAHLVFTDPALQSHREFFAGLQGLPLADQNAAIEREALRNIRDHPLEYAENVAANVSRMFFNLPYSRTEEQLNDVFYVVPNSLVAIAILGLIVLVPRRRRLPPEAGVFAVLAVAGLVLHVLVATYPRMLTPVLPFLFWLTTLALVEARVLRSAAPRRRPAPTGTS